MRLRALVLAALVSGFPAAGVVGAHTTDGAEASAAPAACALEGVVLDATSGAPIDEAVLTLRPGPAPQGIEPHPPSPSLAAVTGPDGRFCLHQVAPGWNIIMAFRIGYLASGTRWAPGSDEHTRIVLRLQRAPFIEQVVVRPKAQRGLWRPPSAAARALSRREIQNSPGSFDDAARALSSLPGVSTISDYKGVIRLGGGEPEEIAFLMDGVLIENPYHFHWSRGSAGGLSAAAFDRISVRTSGLGAGVSDTLSGVIELHPSERGAEGGFLEGSLGTLMSSFTSGGAAFNGAAFGDAAPGSGTWIVSGRYSNLALYRSLYGVESVEVPDFGDLLLRFRRSLGPGLELVAGGLGLSNRLQTSDPDEGTRIDTRSHSGGVYAGLDLAPGPDLLLSSRLSWSGARQRYDHSSGDHLDADERRLRLTIRAEGGGGGDGAGSGARSDAGPRWSAGAEGSLYEGEIAGTLESVDGFRLLDERSTRLGAHAALRLGGRSGWLSEIGARVDSDSRFGDAPLQPRLRLEYAAHSGWNARIGAGRYAQFPRFEQEFLAQGEALAPAVSDEISAGATLPLPAGFDLDVSAYERRMKDLTSEILNRSPDLRERMGRFERGRTRALEVSLRREEGRLHSRLSATLIDARQTRDGVTSARNGDQPYLVSLSLAWLATERWTLLSRLQTGAGLPYSGMMPGGEEEGGLILGPLNGERLPALSRLDLRAVWERPAGAARLRTYFEIANALGRDNLRGRDLRYDPAARRYYSHDEESMPLVPGFGVEITWGGAAERGF